MSFLSALAVRTTSEYRQHASRHLTFLLLVSLLVYVYRDVWPLLTFTLEPEDLGEGNVLWGKVAALAIAGGIIPVFAPRYHAEVVTKVAINVPEGNLYTDLHFEAERERSVNCSFGRDCISLFSSNLSFHEQRCRVASPKGCSDCRHAPALSGE